MQSSTHRKQRNKHKNKGKPANKHKRPEFYSLLQESKDRETPARNHTRINTQCVDSVIQRGDMGSGGDVPHGAFRLAVKSVSVLANIPSLF